MKKLVIESLNEDRISNLKQKRLAKLNPLADAIKSATSNPELFEPDFMDMLTDMWYTVIGEIDNNSF